MSLTHDDVQEILRLLNASNFDELRLETAGIKLVLRRGGTGAEEETSGPPSSSAVPAPERPASPAPSPSGTAGDGVRDIRSPLLGVFYRAPKPGAPPFVDIGSTVGADTVVGIVEVMKLMNSVPAGICGEVVEICATDGKLVEYGQVLMRVKPETP